MKVAFSTTDGAHVDEHFGRAGRFVVYEMNRDGFRRLDDLFFDETMRMPEGHSDGSGPGSGPTHDDVVSRRIERLAECNVVYVTMIGAPSAARLVQRGIMPVKVKEPVAIESAVGELMEKIKTSPPPWMRRLIDPA